MCPHTTIYVSSYYNMCPHTHTATFVSSYAYCHVSVLILMLLHMCPHTSKHGREGILQLASYSIRQHTSAYVSIRQLC